MLPERQSPIMELVIGGTFASEVVSSSAWEAWVAPCPVVAVAKGASTYVAKMTVTPDLILANLKTSPFLHVCSCVCLHSLCQSP